MEIIKEISTFNSFDDTVMNGRNRINKGSKNFHNFLYKSKNIKSFYKSINNFKFYKKLDQLLEKNFETNRWKVLNKINHFSKRNYGLQTGSGITKNFGKKGKKNILNLDIDFSSSVYGYFRSAHRDRDNRVINYIIYLNNINKNDGGALEIFDVIKGKFKKNYPRFPNIKNLRKIKSLRPRKAQFIVFRSTPNSYHGVSKYKSQTKKRIFIYGSFSLNNSVKWKLK